MKIKKVLAAILVAFCFCLVGCTSTEASVTTKSTTQSQQQASNFVSKKVYVTTCGQAQYSDAECLITDPDDGLGLSATCSKTLTAAEVDEGSIVVIIVAYTSKGMGGNITQAGEENRCTDFCERANDGEISLIVLHMGGTTRRGAGTDGMLEDACKAAAYVFAETDGDSDGKITEWAGTKLTKEEDLYDAVDAIEAALRALDGQTA